MQEWCLLLQTDACYDRGRHQGRVLKTLTPQEIQERKINVPMDSLVCQWVSKKGFADHVEPVPVCHLRTRIPQKKKEAMVIVGDTSVRDILIYMKLAKSDTGEAVAVMKDDEGDKVTYPMDYVCGVERVKRV